jgi:hypothetical protein
VTLSLNQGAIAAELGFWVNRLANLQRAAPGAPRFRAVGPTGVPLLAERLCSLDAPLPTRTGAVVRFMWPWTDELDSPGLDLPRNWAERSAVAGVPFTVTSGAGGSLPHAPGDPDEPTRTAIIEVLRRRLVPGQRLWFAYDEIATAMTGHPFTVLSGTFDEADQFRATFYDTLSGGRVGGPSYWWSSKLYTSPTGPSPDEVELWTVVTDYDSYWTDVAGSDELADDLMHHPDLETYLLC